MLESYLNLRNEVDFFLRSRIRTGRAIDVNSPTPENELQFQKELHEFFEILQLKEFVKDLAPVMPLKVLDVGCRNFSTGVTIDQLLAEENITAKIEGIELDPGRRLSDFRTRGDWGRFFAQKLRKGQYHGLNFLNWSESAHVIFLLNPFVEEGATLEWGLPARYADVKPLLEQTHRVLKDSGILVLSSPSVEEWTFLEAHALRAAFNRSLSNVCESNGHQPPETATAGLRLEKNLRNLRALTSSVSLWERGLRSRLCLRPCSHVS